MAEKPKKICLIGLDCALPNSILKYVKQGVLPNLEKIIAQGVWAENGLVPYPTITPPNWTTIATGAWPGTHGITDFNVHEPGTSLHSSNTHQGFFRSDCLVENIWEAAEKAGKASIVLNYPAAHGLKLDSGIVVGGNSISINDWRPKEAVGLTGAFTVCTDQIYSTLLYPQGGVKVTFDDAEEWINAPQAEGDEDQEVKIPLTFRDSPYEMEPVTWYALAQDTKDEGYDRIILSPTKDCSESFCALSKGQWSGPLTTTVKTTSGEEKQVRFHVKLMELSDDLEVFRLYMTGLGECSGWSDPPEVAEELMEHCPDGEFALRAGGYKAYQKGWIDLETYLEALDLQNVFLGGVAAYLMKNKPWDLFFMHAHSPDWIYHAIMRDMDPVAGEDAEKNRLNQEAERKMYMSVDRMIGRIIEAAGSDALVIVVSDHGAVADGPGLAIPSMQPLIEKGLIKTTGTRDELAGDKMGQVLSTEVDWSQTKAIPQRVVHIYVNVKGRDPDGIVEPGEEYEQVRQEIIDTLMTHVDPETGRRVFSMVLRREDARPFGLYGERCGDVIYALYPWFGGQHGNILPTAEWGLGTLKPVIILNGPGIKTGKILERTVWLTDLVPTICYLTDLPLPAHTEGAVIYQAFEDPDFKHKEIQTLKADIAKLEAELG